MHLCFTPHFVSVRCLDMKSSTKSSVEMETFMKKLIKDDNIRRGVTIGVILLLVYWALNNIGTLYLVFNWIISVILPFIVGGVIAFIINVPMRRVEKILLKLRKNKEKPLSNKIFYLIRGMSIFITLLLIIVVISFAMIVVIPQLANTITELIKVLPEQVAHAQNFIMEQLHSVPQLSSFIGNININWDMIISKVMTFVSDGTVGVFISGGFGAITSIISGFTVFIIGFVFSIYILIQKEKLGKQITKVLYAMFKKDKVQRFLNGVEIIDATFSSFLSGQCLEACILGLLFVVCMSICGLPYALLIGVTIAITALIPIVGAFIGLIIGMLLIALVSPFKAVAFLVLFLVLQQIEGNLIYPHVVGNSVGLPGLWTLVALTLGGNLFGVIGMLVFIPIFSIAYTFFKTYINNIYDKKYNNVDKN